MILRPLQPSASASEKSVSAWEAVQHTQTAKYESCWLITQPSHAALAGELAANICAPDFPSLDTQLLQAIALHDAGWGIPDAQALVKSRSVHPHQPQSFIAAGAAQFAEAWKSSIETCQSVSPAGGYMVSRHFWRLASERGPATAQGRQDQRILESFLKNEEQRQKKLAAKQERSIEELERLTDLLQFCDLLSLYLCCGATENVMFPEYFGIQLRVSNQRNNYKLDPPAVKAGSQFAVAALRYPATKQESSREMHIKIE